MTGVVDDDDQQRGLLKNQNIGDFEVKIRKNLWKN
jgi:hypothetical protein